MPTAPEIPYSAIFQFNDIDPQGVETTKARARAHLRQHNRKEKTVYLLVPGTLQLHAGNVVLLSGFGVFDKERWEITSISHGTRC